MRFVLIAAFVVASLAGCTDSGGNEAGPAVSPTPAPSGSVDMPPTDIGSPKPLRSEPGGHSASAGTLLMLSASGYGPYRVGQSQQELVDAKMARAVKVDETGCVIGWGSKLMNAPRLRFVGGKLAQIELTTPGAVTDTGLMIGAQLPEAQEKYPDGKVIYGPAGAGWETVDGENALLVKITGDDVTALIGGLATSVERRYKAGMGC
ncbi:hypothetical protein ACQP2E_36585 [Actinoplanes sp. CA-015351]|uniref:hypothetical protein n=1 Tax=Actinoplanes sp. CA-015351 TaxID=3239897 RepID=UPI003D97E8F7